MKLIINLNYHFFFALLAILLVGCLPGQLFTPQINLQGTQVVTSPPNEKGSPTVSADMGGFHIRLVYYDNSRPVRAQSIYLAGMLPVQGGQKGVFVPSLDFNTAPRTRTTNQGNVVTSMIPPGKYALALFAPQGAILVKEATTNKEIIFDITPGQITDLGDQKVLLDPKLLEPSK
jgi:hypothetical protein